MRERVDLARDSGDFALADCCSGARARGLPLTSSARRAAPSRPRAARASGTPRARSRRRASPCATPSSHASGARRARAAREPDARARRAAAPAGRHRGGRGRARERRARGGDPPRCVARPPASAARPASRCSVRLAEILRGARRFTECPRRASPGSRPSRPIRAARARGLLERARVERDAGREAEAEAAYGLVITLAREPRVLEAAVESGRGALEQSGDWDRARGAVARRRALGGARATRRVRAAGRAPWLAEAEPEARSARGPASTPSRRGSGAPWCGAGATVRAADSALARIASLPGYGFYSQPAPARPSASAAGREMARDLPRRRLGACAPLATVRDLLAARRAVEEAMLTLNRWSVRDPRVAGAGRYCATPARCSALARLAYAAGVDRARRSASPPQRRRAAPTPRRSGALGRVVWIYPAAFDSLYARFPLTLERERRTGAAPGADVAGEQVRPPGALAQQRHRPHPAQARPRPQVARRRHEAPPGEIALTDPARAT